MNKEISLKRIIEDGGKITNATITEKDKITNTTKIELANGEVTNSTITTTKDEININF